MCDPLNVSGLVISSSRVMIGNKGKLTLLLVL